MNSVEKFSIKTLEIAGLKGALEALRLPFGKEPRSECYHCYESKDYDEDAHFVSNTACIIDKKDLKLMSTLVKRGDEHSKCIRGIQVWVEINAPVWLYRELETYRVGRDRLGSNSTMHQECKGLSGEELEKAKDAIPMGLYQKTIDVISYQTLRRIWIQRHNHRLPMWHKFCDWINTLPFAQELILVGLNNEE